MAPVSVICLLQVFPAQGAVKAATVAHVGDQCLREGKIAPGRAIDGTDLVCMRATLGSSRGALLWWYSKLTPMKILEIIVPIISRKSDLPEVVASRSADRIGKAIGTALKSEGLVTDFSSKNFAGGSGSWALSTFQAYKNRLSTAFIGSQTLINGLITTKSSLKLSDSKAIAQLVQEYEAIAVPTNSKYRTLEQLVNDLHSNPNEVNFIGGSLGSVDHVFFAKVLNSIQVDPKVVNYLPQKSGFEVVTKTLSNNANVALSTSGDFVAKVSAGKMRVLGIASPKKVGWLKAKTMQQQGVNVIYGNWYGILVPPKFGESETSNLLHLLDVLQNSKVWSQTLADNYWVKGYLSPKEFLSHIEVESSETREIFSQLGF